MITEGFQKACVPGLPPSGRAAGSFIRPRQIFLLYAMSVYSPPLPFIIEARGAAVTASAVRAGTLTADFDHDGDVDQEDCRHLEVCSLGPSVPQNGPGCRDADLDGDGDGDQEDFAILQRQHGSRSLRCGIGLSPRTFDAPGFLDAFDEARHVASIGLVQVPLAWDLLHGVTDCRTYLKSYDWLVVPHGPDGTDLFSRHGLKRAFWLNFLDPNQPSGLNLTDYSGAASFTNPELADAYVNECIWFADHFVPDYLAIATELDSYLSSCPAGERAALFQTLVRVVSAIKARHPATVVFVYFQYENVMAQNLWTTIQPFADMSQLYAFSSYPSLPLNGPDTGFTASTLPDDYYAPIRARLGASHPAAFVELGHPAAPSTFFSAGSEQEQSAFIDRFFAILPENTSLAVWTYLHDPGFLSMVYPSEVADYFGSIGMLRLAPVDSRPPSWQQWRDLSGGS